mgnify:CR=1 FL=1
MPIVLLLIFLLIMKKNFKTDNIASTISKIIVSLIALSVIPALLITFLLNPFCVAILVAILVSFAKKQKLKKKEDDRKKQYGWDAEKWNKENNNADIYSTYVKPTPKNSKFPKSVSKRKRIVEKFNNTYNLNLTNEQIQSMVNASYMSNIWLAELEAMDEKYESVYEWFGGGPTAWLRAYMYVFHVQDITSDVGQQENIAMYAFQEVFSYADTIKGYPLSDIISKVNSKFLSEFDDVSFMIAYRFLESKGLKHDIGTASIIRNDSEIDKLLEKYKDQELDGKSMPM